MIFFIFTTVRTSINMDLQNTFQKLQETLSSDTRILYHVISVLVYTDNQNLNNIQNTSEHTTGSYVGYIRLSQCSIYLISDKNNHVCWTGNDSEENFCDIQYLSLYLPRRTEENQKLNISILCHSHNSNPVPPWMLSQSQYTGNYALGTSLSLCLYSPEPKLLNIIRE